MHSKNEWELDDSGAATARLPPACVACDEETGCTPYHSVHGATVVCVIGSMHDDDECDDVEVDADLTYEFEWHRLCVPPLHAAPAAPNIVVDSEAGGACFDSAQYCAPHMGDETFADLSTFWSQIHEFDTMLAGRAFIVAEKLPVASAAESEFIEKSIVLSLHALLFEAEVHPEITKNPIESNELQEPSVSNDKHEPSEHNELHESVELPLGGQTVKANLSRFRNVFMHFLMEGWEQIQSIDTDHMSAAYFESSMLVHELIFEELCSFTGPSYFSELLAVDHHDPIEYT